jgi:hypothetical protein
VFCEGNGQMMDKMTDRKWWTLSRTPIEKEEIKNSFGPTSESEAVEIEAIQLK